MENITENLRRKGYIRERSITDIVDIESNYFPAIAESVAETDYYAISSNDREKVMEFLKENKINTEMLIGDPYKFMCDKLVEDYIVASESELKPLFVEDTDCIRDRATIYLMDESNNRELELFNYDNLINIMKDFK